MNKIGVHLDEKRKLATIVTLTGKTVVYRIQDDENGSPSRGEYLAAKSTGLDTDMHRQHVEVTLILAFGHPDEPLFFDVSSFYDENGLTIGWEHPLYLHCLTVGSLAGDGISTEAWAPRHAWLSTRQQIQAELTAPTFSPGKVGIRSVRKMGSGSVFGGMF